VDCNVPGDVAVGGGVGYPPAVAVHPSSVLLESTPDGTNGWEGFVYSPFGDDAQVYVVCASLGFG
jgi:hypothetical protein